MAEIGKQSRQSQVKEGLDCHGGSYDLILFAVGMGDGGHQRVVWYVIAHFKIIHLFVLIHIIDQFTFKCHASYCPGHY